MLRDPAPVLGGKTPSLDARNSCLSSKQIKEVIASMHTFKG